jgi:hypothetical protein
VSFEEVAKAGKLPPAVARALCKLWRGETEKPKADPAAVAQVQVGGVAGSFQDLALMFGNVSALNDKALLMVYEPLGRADVVTELNNRGGNRPFIVFSDHKTLKVDTEKSFDILQLLKQSVDVGAHAKVGDSLVDLFRPGELPDMAIGICPIHGCHLIGDDEFCPQCSRNWKGASTDLRELVWCHVQEVLGKVPEANDPILQQVRAALGNANDQYWVHAKLVLQNRKATGQVIVLVKPVKRTTGRPQQARR